MALALAPTQAIRAAIYIRVSTLEQGEHGYGLDTQLTECRRLLGELDAEEIAVFEDRDSGASWTLPGLNAMLDAAKRGEFDTLIIYDPDRLSRRMAKYVVLEQEIKKAGVQIRFVTIRGGDTPEDRVLHQMKAVFAEYDYERTIFRLARGKRTKAERGLVVGTGVAPYGYRYLRNEKGRAYALEVNPETAPIVQRIFQDVQRLSLRAVCDQLNADQVPTYFAARATAGWTSMTLAGILANPVYLGTAPYGRRDGQQHWQDPNGWIYSSAPPLVDRGAWDAAHASLERRRALRQRPPRTPESDAAYPLRGMLTCAHCGGALACSVTRPARSAKVVRYYTCLRNEAGYARRRGIARCPLPGVPAGPIEAIAWDEIIQTLLDPKRLSEGLAAARAEHDVADSRRAARLDSTDQEIARLRSRLNRVLDEQLDAPSGSESARLLREKGQQIESLLGRLQAERATLAAEPTIGLSETQTTQLAEFAAQVRAGLDHAANVERRRVCQMLQLQGVVHLDAEHGLRLARRNRFTVDWKAAIQLSRIDREFVNIMAVHISDPGGTSVPVTSE